LISRGGGRRGEVGDRVVYLKLLGSSGEGSRMRGFLGLLQAVSWG
jgi:hypothetical protein